MTVDPSPRALVAIGVTGAVLAAAGSYWVAATPLSFRLDPPPVVDLMAPQAPAARVAWYLGTALMALAWLGFGRRMWRGEALDWRTLRTAGLATAAPLLLAVPLSSRDLWAYAAQARIAAVGLDPYTVPPSQLGGGFAANVSARWIDAPSPYGPLWTLLGRGLEALTGSHELLAVLVLRLPAALGFALLAFAVPAIARRVGASPATACWLVLANPMVVLHGVGGGHNDTLMVGLLALGLLVAVSPGPRWRAMLIGGLLVGAAAAIKVPAVVAAPFLPLLWQRYVTPGWTVLPWREAVRRRAGDVVVGLAWSLGGAVAVLAVASLAAGRGLAWVSAANTTEHGGGPALTVLLGVVLVALWLLALRNAQLPLLAAALVAPAMVSTLSLAWYWFWPLVPAAMIVRGRLATFLLAVGSLAEIFYIRPNGQNFALRPELVVVVVAVVTWVVLDRRWRPFGDDPNPARLTSSHITTG